MTWAKQEYEYKDVHCISSNSHRISLVRQHDYCIALIHLCGCCDITCNIYHFLSEKLRACNVILLFGLGDWFSATTCASISHYMWVSTELFRFTGLMHALRPVSQYLYIVLLFEKYMYTGRSETLFVVHVLNKSIACM